jgi:hypothetical protein
MTPQHVRHAARWLQRQDAAQQARAAALEAARRTDQHARRQRVARQARDARGRWVRRP